MRERPWWQLMHVSLVSAADILVKRRGMGLLKLFRCSVGSPWQVAQPTMPMGVRLSAFVPCLPPQMATAPAWQVAQTLPVLMSSADCAHAPAGTISAPQKAKSAANNRAPLDPPAVSPCMSVALLFDQRKDSLEDGLPGRYWTLVP